MAKKKKGPERYRIHWSMDTREPGTIDVPAEDVEGMTERRRKEYFQECVDEEVNRNGPCGFVDSVEEIDE